jgi:exonuclease VII large subunit
MGLTESVFKNAHEYKNKHDILETFDKKLQYTDIANCYTNKEIFFKDFSKELKNRLTNKIDEKNKLSRKISHRLHDFRTKRRRENGVNLKETVLEALFISSLPNWLAKFIDKDSTVTPDNFTGKVHPDFKHHKNVTYTLKKPNKVSTNLQQLPQKNINI